MDGRRSHDLKECINGHAFTPENTYINPRKGIKECRECRRDSRERYKETQREDLASLDKA